MTSTEFSFDSQASEFDDRAGLPPGVAQEVAQAIARVADVGQGHRALELGAGTGEIGAPLGELVSGYLGVDVSRPMLQAFRARRPEAALLHGDACVLWPVSDGSVHLVFLSRAAHLMPVEHLVSEVLRVGDREHACLLLGRVKRDRKSPRHGMRKKMRELLAERGTEGRRGEDTTERILEELVRAGCERIERTVAARYPARHTARQSLDSWRGKSGLAGVAIEPTAKDELLRELSDWAESTFGSLDDEVTSEERYALEGVRLPRG